MPTSGSPGRKELSVYPQKMPPILDDRLVVTTKKEPIRQEVIKNSSASRKPRHPQPILLIPVACSLGDPPPRAGQAAILPTGIFHHACSVRQRHEVRILDQPRIQQFGQWERDVSEIGVEKAEEILSQQHFKGTNNTNRKLEQKKNVTFNAFATVQLMEE
ncbi:uncharacterized protein CEXT_127081 [Caerostris extrusa]|uniref:Uncharacterized protein n=1 Tax=Caerostris extrusa TaxID=172846 RepID=A0AAV4Y2M2_CAEEX|nr:uncharacterized protein CEXT_127081 [Caerostris extrusa]